MDTASYRQKAPDNSGMQRKGIEGALTDTIWAQLKLCVFLPNSFLNPGYQE